MATTATDLIQGHPSAEKALAAVLPVESTALIPVELIAREGFLKAAARDAVNGIFTLVVMIGGLLGLGVLMSSGEGGVQAGIMIILLGVGVAILAPFIGLASFFVGLLNPGPKLEVTVASLSQESIHFVQILRKDLNYFSTEPKSLHRGEVKRISGTGKYAFTLHLDGGDAVTMVHNRAYKGDFGQLSSMLRDLPAFRSETSRTLEVEIK